MKYLGKIEDNKDLVTKEYVDNSISEKEAIQSDTPQMDGTASIGSSARFARADHVHPTDTTIRGTAAPLMDGAAAVGNSNKYARENHVHPTDTSRASKGIIADDFSSSHPYKVGEYCIYNEVLYKCTTAHNGAWDSSHWVAAPLGPDVTDLRNALVQEETYTDWEVGGINSTGGTNTTDSTRLRLTKFVGINTNIASVRSLTGYDFSVFAWNNSTGVYVGTYTSSGTFINGGTAKWVSSFNFAAYSAYKFKIVLRNATQTSAEMSVSDGTNVLFSICRYDTDDTLTKEHRAADAKATGDAVSYLQTELDEKPNRDGYYEQMTVGNAEQLVSNVGITDKVPYNFRASGGSLDIGDREKDAIVGGTVVWNQFAPALETTSWGVTDSATYSIVDGVATIHGDESAGAKAGLNIKTANRIQSVIGNKYLFTAVVSTTNGVVRILPTGAGADGGTTYSSYPTKTRISYIWSPEVEKSISFTFLGFTGGSEISSPVDFTVEKANAFDLTKMFGSTIADYIYGLEQATAGTGVAWFCKLFPKLYYAYNTGELLSVNSSYHKMIGFNAWDEEWEVGGFNTDTGEPMVKDDRIRSKNYIPIIQAEEYYFKIPGNSGWRFFYYDCDKNYISYAGTFYGSKLHSFPEGVAFIKFWLAGRTTYSNDVCLNISDQEKNDVYEPYKSRTYQLDSDLLLRGIPKLDANNKLYYDGDVYNSDGTVIRNYDVRPYTSGDESLTDAITDGTNTVYKLTTSTTESANPYNNPQIVDNWGTEEYVDAGITASTPTRDVAIPVGHETFYQNNLRAKLEAAPESPLSDGSYIMQRTNGKNTYIPLVIPTELPTNPSTNGTYTLKLTVADGTATLSWMSDT